MLGLAPFTYLCTMSPQEIDELEAWFADMPLPKSYRISRAFYLPDVRHSLELEFHFLRANLNKPFQAGPVTDRLRELERHFKGELSYPQD